jgi:hypothetical protein
MTTTASIAELLKAGVILDAGEAVAIAQQLIQALRQNCDGGGIEPPYGPPTAANVVLNADGSVSCAACGTTPAISEIAIFLDSLLPASSPRVPGGLRYIIARGLLEVDVAPFDSLEEFSAALKRHERIGRHEAVRSLLKRAEAVCAGACLRSGDRRRPRETATDLRRALRDADARLYQQQLVASVPVVTPPRRPKTAQAMVACVGSGLMLIGVGEFMYGRASESAPIQIAAPAAPAAPAGEVSDQLRVPQLSAVQSAPSPLVEAPSPSAVAPALRASETSRPARRIGAAPRQRERADRTGAKRAPRPSTISEARPQRPGVLDRLRLGWLRNAFALRPDAL